VLDGSSVIDSSGQLTELSLALPGRANRSNAVMALAVAEVFGVSPAAALQKMRSVTSVAGRYTQVQRNGRNVRLLLAKNPAGWLEAFDVLDPAPVPVLLSVNALSADGTDTSWLWDVDYTRLAGHKVLVIGQRRLDLAVRLQVAGVQFEVFDTVEAAVDAAPAGEIEVIANYTAFQQLRQKVGG
jgi:UDP-N-acetylmuramyl tripeptide synthase